MKSFLITILGFSLALSLTGSALAAETPTAMLYSTGSFALNGSVGPQSSAVMPGDQIQTRDGSSVSITSTGNDVLIGPNSSLVYEHGAIQFAGGTAVVSTATSMSADVQGATVAPAQPKATYRITQTGDRIMVAALRGNLLLRQGAETRTIAEGSSAYVPDPVPQAVPGAQQPVGSRPGKKTGMIIGAAALGATTAIILTQIGPENSVSPTLP